MTTSVLTSETKKERATLFGVVFSLFLVRFLFYGFTYFPQLDDYIQLTAELNVDTLMRLIHESGILAARPLAGLMDATLWSLLFPVMILGLILIAAMYATSAVIFHRLAHRHFGCGTMFLVVYCLLPLAFEGTYWVSASNRIVPSLFFAALAAHWFDDLCQTGKKTSLLWFLVTQTLAFGFYEQGITITLTVTALLGMYYLANHQWRGFYAIGAIIPCGIYVLVTKFAPASALYATRTGIILPGRGYYIDTFLPVLFSQLNSAFLGGGFYTLVKGFFRGAVMIWNDGALLYLIVIVALCVCLFFRLRKLDVSASTGQLWAGVGIGFLLMLAPISPFFIIEVIWFSLRCTVMPLLGIGIMCDCIVRLVIKRLPKLRSFVHVGACLLAFVCCVAAVSELHDYRETYFDDQQVRAVMEKTMPETDEHLRVGLLGLEISYLDDVNCNYHEHIHGCTQSDWATTGLMHNVEKLRPHYFVPFPITTNAYFGYDAAAHQVDKFDCFYYYQHDAGTATMVYAELQPNGSYLFRDDSGTAVLHLTEENKIGTLTPIG